MQTVIKIENLYKEYRLGTIGYGTLREDLQSWWAKTRGKPDPNSIISQVDGKFNSFTDRILALNNINLEIKEGDRLGIIGKNGAGKTTLLKILSQISSPSSGKVKVKGRTASLIALGTGFQPEFTGRENIYLNGTIMGLRKFEIDKYFDEIVDFSGVEKFIDTPVKRYSSGMYIRLGFAVAAYLDPDILIVDEVLAIGDDEFRKKAIGKMRDISSTEGRTVIFVSHNMGAIKELCNKAICISEGKVAMASDTDSTINYYLNITSIAENPEYNFLENHTNLFKFNNIRIMDKNALVSSHFEMWEDFTIEINYTVLKKITKSIISVSIEKQGVSILKSYDNDFSEEKFNFREAGQYIVKIKFNNILSVGTYSVSISAFQPIDDIDLGSFPNVITFNINENHNISHKSYGLSPSMVVTKFPWEYTFKKQSL